MPKDVNVILVRTTHIPNSKNILTRSPTDEGSGQLILVNDMRENYSKYFNEGEMYVVDPFNRSAEHNEGVEKIITDAEVLTGNVDIRIERDSHAWVQNRTRTSRLSSSS